MADYEKFPNPLNALEAFVKLAGCLAGVCVVLALALVAAVGVIVYLWPAR